MVVEVSIGPENFDVGDQNLQRGRVDFCPRAEIPSPEGCPLPEQTVLSDLGEDLSMWENDLVAGQAFLHDMHGGFLSLRL